MIRLHIIAEGQTEQRFATSTLAPYLAERQIFVDSRCVMTSKDNRTHMEYRGGLISYIKARNDILRWIKEDSAPECRFTTMFDLYALPKDFPAYTQIPETMEPYTRVEALEGALKDDIDHPKFIPYIQLHEFEALILAAPQRLDWEYLEHDAAIKRLITMVGDQNPELINHARETAPSKRIIKEIPEYEGDKTVGAEIAARIGIPTLRQRCAHFNQWLTRLEALQA